MKSVLVVDTDRNTLDFLKGHLDAPNLMVRTAYGGEDALSLLAYRRFDLLISALEMPHPNGVDLLVELRDKDPNIPVIFLSKLFRQNEGARERLRSVGPYTLLDKPIFMNRLYETIEDALQFKISWEDKRSSPRYPIRLDLTFSFIAPTGRPVFVKAKTLDLSLGGVCFERMVCELCTGYERGGVHRDCVLTPYAFLRQRSIPLDLRLHISEKEALVLKGKVMRTLIQEGTTREFVGIRFVDMTQEHSEKLKALLKQYAR